MEQGDLQLIFRVESNTATLHSGVQEKQRRDLQLILKVESSLAKTSIGNYPVRICAHPGDVRLALQVQNKGTGLRPPCIRKYLQIGESNVVKTLCVVLWPILFCMG